MGELIGALCGIAGAIISGAITWGVLKTKVNRLEVELEKMEKRYVETRHFESTIRPISEHLHELRQDVKVILAAVAKWEYEVDLVKERRKA